MNNYAPIARVLIRYIAGIAIGAEYGYRLIYTNLAQSWA